MLFKQLFHGHDTNVEENNQHSIYHNRNFPTDENYNFIILNERIEDFDLFNLISDEQTQTKAPLRIITLKTNNKNLFESLNFDVEIYQIFENKKLRQTKASTEVTIEESCDLSEYQSYRDSFTDHRIEEKLFKARKNSIVVARLEGSIVGSMLLHDRDEFIEVDDLFILENERAKGIGSALLNYAKAQGKILRLLVDQDQAYLNNDFKNVETILVATRY